MKTKALINCTVTMQLICFFVFTYAKIRFSHNAAHLDFLELHFYCKVPKFSDARKFCCNQSKIQTKRPNLRVFCQKDALPNGIANSEDSDQTAPRGAV